VCSRVLLLGADECYLIGLNGLCREPFRWVTKTSVGENMRRYFKNAACGLLVALMVPTVAVGLCLEPIGDVDGTGATNVIDVQCSILTALSTLSSEASAPGCLAGDESTADVDCSGAVNVTDVVLVVQLSLGESLASSLDGNGDGCPDSCQTTSTCEQAGCDDSDPCTVDTCVPEHEEADEQGCVYDTVFAFGKSCDDGDACTFPDICDFEGFCDPGFPVECDDSDPCTTDHCDPSEGCVHLPVQSPGCP